MRLKNYAIQLVNDKRALELALRRVFPVGFVTRDWSTFKELRRFYLEDMRLRHRTRRVQFMDWYQERVIEDSPEYLNLSMGRN